jgi:hypothetical protein
MLTFKLVAGRSRQEQAMSGAEVPLWRGGMHLASSRGTIAYLYGALLVSHSSATLGA